MNEIIDPHRVTSCPENEEPPGFSLLLQMESPVDDASAGLFQKPAGKELLAGTAGSVLVHCLLLTSFLLHAHYLQPPRPVLHPFMNVYLASIENAGERPGNFGASDLEEGGQDSAGCLVEAKQTESVEALTPPALVRRELESSRVEESISERKRADHKAKPRPRSKKPEAVKSPAPLPKTGAEDIEGSAQSQPGHSPDSGTGIDPGRSSQGRASGSGSAGGEFDAAVVDDAPRVLSKCEPVYPQKARSLGICGKVVLRFLVEPNGRVSHPGIVEAHPRGYFEQSALEAVRRWRFKPGYVHGKAVATWFTLPVQFKLVDEE